MSNRPAGIYHSELLGVVRGLQHLVGRRLSEVRQPRRDALYLGFSDGTGLWLEVHPVPRLHPVDRHPRNPKTPFSFQSLLRSRSFPPLDRFTVDAEDRNVDLVFGDLTVHARLYPGGGIWLVEGDGVVGGLDGPAPDALPSPPPPGDGLPPPPRFSLEDGPHAAQAYFEDAVRTWALAARRSHDLKHLRGARKKAKRLVANLQRDLEATEAAASLRRSADALAAVLHTIAPRSTEVTVRDLHDPNLEHVVALDPRARPSATLQRLYDKAKRLERAEEHLWTRLEDATAALDALEAAVSDVPEADPRTLRALEKRHKLPRFELGRVRSDRASAEPTLWETWEGPQGQRMFVGRSGAANRKLVFGKAKGYDVWFHLREVAGAHVVLQARKDAPPPLASLLACAEMVLRKARVAEGEPREVQYAQVRHLRAIPGDTSGKVLVHHEKVLLVSRDPDALRGWEKRDARR